MAIAYFGAVPAPGQEGHVSMGPYGSISELARAYVRVVMQLEAQGFTSPGDRFRFYGHVEEDGVDRDFTEAEEAALGAHWRDRDE